MKKLMAIFVLSIFMFSALPVDAMSGNTGWSIKNVNENAVQKYNQVKERYSLAAREWNGLSNDFRKVKEKINRFDNLNSEDQSMVLERTQLFLTKTLERMDLHLDMMESWSERITVSDERKALILEDIEEKRDQLEEFKMLVESSETLEDLRILSKEIKESWRDFTPKIKHISGELLTAKIGNILEDSEELSISLQEKLDALDQSAEEVISMQQHLDKFNVNLDLAKEQYELAQEKYSQIESVSDANDLFKETKEFVFAARDYLREAHKSLKELVKEYREFTGNVPSNDEEEDLGGEKYPEIEDGTEE